MMLPLAKQLSGSQVTGTMHDTSNTSFTVGAINSSNGTIVWDMDPNHSGNAGAGIVVGTGNVANVPDQVALGSQIANGSGAGQLQIGAMTIAFSVVSNVMKIVLSRPFTNASGASITISEVGLYATNYDSTGTAAHLCILERTLFSVVVANGNVVTIEYDITVAC